MTPDELREAELRLKAAATVAANTGIMLLEEITKLRLLAKRWYDLAHVTPEMWSESEYDELLAKMRMMELIE